VKTLNLTDQKNLQSLFRKHNLWPNKNLSQNFLIDKNVLAEVIKAADIQKDEKIIEVGAGAGVLSQELANLAKQVIAVEYDEKILPLLKNILEKYKNIEIVTGDIMQINLSELLARLSNPKEYQIVANLPYHLTSHFIKKFLEADQPPTKMTLLLQREVAERICAKPGQMSVLSVSVQVLAEPKLCAYVPKTAFWPQPKVDSAIINIKRRIKPLIAPSENHYFFSVIKAAFAARRKTLVNAISANFREKPNKIKGIIKKMQLPPLVRAQELSLDQWIEFSRHLGDN
jgi:16S rRNA (adenine1518-N6/adenine1519-N6)-dimethyltransferase